MAEHKKTEPWRIFFRYVFEFAAAGFAGWLYEVATVWVMYHYFDNRGMLHLPIIPIYAVGAFILLALLRKGILDIPLMFILQAFLPMYGIVWATPIADILCCGVSVVLFVIFINRHGQNKGIHKEVAASA